MLMYSRDVLGEGDCRTCEPLTSENGSEHGVVRFLFF
jgi:hypothetical protein